MVVNHKTTLLSTICLVMFPVHLSKCASVVGSHFPRGQQALDLCPCFSLKQIENIDACLCFLAAKGVNIKGLCAEGERTL